MTKPTGRRKVQYLPEAENDLIIIGGADGPAYPVDTAEPVPAPEPEPEPQEPAGIFWENVVFDPGEDDPSDENQGMTLRQGRENYRRWGAMHQDFLRLVRPPRPSEFPPPADPQ